MHNILRYTIAFVLLIASLGVSAQNIRYVNTSGKYANDGKSWANAKRNIQDAINDLVDNGLTGEVWVAAGTYTPTESTESSGGSTLYMSFKIPAGIKVYGGFAGNETSKTQRAKTNNDKIGWTYTNKTILSGDLSEEAKFTWNATKKVYDTSFFGNCYHVVWFATKGFDSNGRALPLSGEALLEGCVVKDGNARNTTMTGRAHNAYGGGIYMVEGAKVENCTIYNCEASRDGGAVYMDGGGFMEHCYISQSQALGVGVENGYGGGVCIESNKSKKAFGLKGCIIVNNVGRLGGGLAIKIPNLTAEDGSDIRFKPYASSVLVTNNTATTEAGGVYMLRGGALAQMTIVNNQCNGTGITSNSIVTGRAAGLYCRDNAYVINSVIWGGECTANNNIQYASSRSSNTESLKVDMHYCSLSMSDYVDWSGTKKVNVSSLSAYNDADSESAAGASSSASTGYPMFNNPPVAKGYLAGGSDAILNTYYFQPRSISSLVNAGLLSIDWDVDGILPFGEIVTDIPGKRFNPRSTQGSYTPESIVIAPEINGNNVNFYIDEDADKGIAFSTLGGSWDNPLRFISNAMYFISQHASDYVGKTVNVYVKEGTIDNTNSFVEGRIRMISIDIPSNVNIYGGYPSALTGTNLEETIGGVKYRRNPILYPSIITGKVTSDYENNVAHLLRFDGCQNVLFDGFQVRYANASSSNFTNTSANGAGMSFLNGANVSVRNTLIAGCTAEQGAAIYASGSSQVSFVNCIIHNNASSTLKGIIYSEGTAQLTFDHCDFLRNVGYAGYIKEGSSSKQFYTNSIFFGNMNEAIANTNQEAGGGIDKCMPAFGGETANATGSYCMFDNKSAQFMDQFDGNKLGKWQYDLQYTFNQGSGEGYPRFINPTKNTGVSPGGDATFNGRATSFEPHNNNPVVNAANNVGDHTTWGTDITTIVTRDYGGLPDIGAVENHYSATKVSENDYIDGQPAYGVVTYVRDYNTYTYDAQGNATLVEEDLATSANGRSRNGISWETAINGNATYSSSTQLTTYELVATPTTSTIANPRIYKIGMLGGHVPGNTVYFARNVSGNYMRSTTTAADGDDFILINSGTTSQYYIYNLTQGRYVGYTQSTEGANTVQLVTTNNPGANQIWRIKSYNNGESYRTWVFVPSAAADNTTTSPSWNYHGGVTNNIGLYRSSDANSKWVFYEEKVTSITDDVNGLQYAVNTAHEMMSANFNTRTQTVSEKYDGGTANTTHTYYDFTPTAENPQREVWVGAGIYTNPKGYVLRNHVKVYGAFPKTGNPGKDQRHPQLTTGVSLSVANQGLTIHDYETILQTHTSLAAAKASTHQNASVLSHPVECRVTVSNISNVPQDRVVYEGAEWDGFTMRYGFKEALNITGSGGRRNGGAGLLLYEGVVVTNCVIRDNYLEGVAGRGAGVYVDGSTLINCYIMDNSANCSGEIYGGGLYMIKGTIYNSVITGNDVGAQSNNRQGAGIFVEAATFYNNTVVNNKNAAAVGVWTASGASAYLTVYNSIIMGGTNPLLNKNNSTPVTFQNSFLQSTTARSGNTASGVTVNASLDYCGSTYLPATYHPFALNYATATQNYDYRLTQKESMFNAVNAGTEAIGDGITLPDYDMDYTERIQDCEVDMGAFEFNGAFSINPDLTSVDGQAIFYVTPKGYGMASANNPTNAACAEKLQKVLDAAGRYKYNNPDKRVIVKVANDNTTETKNVDEQFKYFSTRSTDATDQDVRVWSIIVPRGIEVWGGYTDTYTNADNNGFYTKSAGTYTDNRDITGHPTYFDSYYFNKQQKNGAYVYHVVTFTDKVFDSDGKPYMATDIVGQNSSYANLNGDFLSMQTKTQDRAVVDGIYITGGNANLQVTTSGTETIDINQYGGGAIVTDYAHVRNCILRNNKGIYGGALALTHNALVSGCLIDQNTAEYGGAIYVFEDGAQLSNGTIINTDVALGENLDANMSRIYTSTIVNNKANTQGGGIWFSQNKSNVRVNSTVIWQNDSQDQANISGLYNPDKPSDETSTSVAFYPFAYCAAQNIRLAGNNNLNLNNINKMGTRFVKEGAANENTLAVETSATGFDKYSEFGYYGLTNYSVLVRTGMPVNEYEKLKLKGLADGDFKAIDRFVGSTRSFIDIGARAIEKYVSTNMLMLRLYVAHPEDINMSAAEDMMNINVIEGSSGYNPMEAYYAQEGSSFAYPMQSVQDAIDYIKSQRTVQQDGTLATADANNLPFEICIAKGTYYPTRDLSGRYGYSLDNTFVIPEGVSLIGGFDCNEAVDELGNDAGANSFYGRYNTKGIIKPVGSDPYYITENVDNLTDNMLEIVGSHATYKMRQLPIKTMVDARKKSDINANNIIEPWEFTYQTVLSGDVDNVRNTGVLHVMSVYPDQTLTGALPKRSIDYSTTTYQQEGTEGYGTTDHEEGQLITLDGLTVVGGYAHTYVPGAIADAGKFNYYHGGGLIVDGKRFCDDYNLGTNDSVVYKYANVSNAVAYRDVPVAIIRCKFEDNHAGYGAAISSNATIDIFNSSFEHNKAESGHDHNVDYRGSTYEVSYPGLGGAIYATHQVTAFNTIFANNEAYDKALNAEVAGFKSLRNQELTGTGNTRPNKVIGGSGGAVYVGRNGVFHMVNCNFVHNQANAYPAVFTMNPNKQETENMRPPEYSQFTNTLFWHNEVNSEMTAKYDAVNPYFKFASKLICNFGKPERTTDYEPHFSAGYSPMNQAELDTYQETAWFCAYEKEKGITQNNAQDLRDAEYTPLKHVMHQLRNVRDKNGDLIPYQNCNIALAHENTAEEGPNFANPSPAAGYAGYAESADWSPTRLNNLTDMGSGKIMQTIHSNGEQYSATFNKYANDSDVPNNPENRRIYSSETAGDYITSGAYTTTKYLRGYRTYNQNIPLGDDVYMTSAYVFEDGSQQKLYRISYDPNPTHNQTYIDIGVYEYPHTELQFATEGDEVDILWVSPIEKPDNGLPDGSAWSQPTSDLQRAIETLLASRNGHRKEIRLMNGTFTPIYNINDYLAFYIDTKYLNESVILPEGQTTLGVKSLTIKGGYSRELNGVYDAEEYPAIIRQQQRTDATSERWNHLLYIGDPTQRIGKDDGNTDPTKVLPIEIDGVTFVNNQANSNTKGAAIFYEDLDNTVTGATDILLTNIVDGTHTSVTKTSPAKLVVSKTKVMASGTNYEVGQNDKTSSAVYIGRNGGYALLYNNVMHSNYGNPLESECRTQLVNNTFAMNRGLVNITGSGSQMFNNVMWKNNQKDNPADGYNAQFVLHGYTSDAASGDIFKRNAYTGGVVDHIDYSSGHTVETNNYNVGLSDDNSDVILGPNFVDPENDIIESRYFALNPSLKLLNKGDDALYNSTLTDAAFNIYDMAWIPTADIEVADNNRFVNTIDIGAYEYQNSLHRVLYVNPNNATSGTGTSWATPIGFGELQRAIDMAALYHVNNVTDEAYVFVKGASSTNASLHTGETLSIRDGVSVYGGINPAYTTDCIGTSDEYGNVVYQPADLNSYVNEIRNTRDGVVEGGSNKTTISGIMVSDNTSFTANDENITSVVDGFVVTATTNSNPNGVITSPVISVSPRTTGSRLVLRNILVRDNNISASAGKSIAEIDNALIYEALFRDNAAANDGAVLKLGTNGYAVNVTVEGKTIGADGSQLLNGGDEAESHVHNSIVNYKGVAATENTLSGYNYAVSDKNLNYQLAEGSKHIDECSADNPISSVTNLAGFINYTTDRDLLGNPRLINNASAKNKIDRGAFETWKIEKDAVITSAATGYYPREGSVVYITEGKNLVLATELVPAYLLLKEGASLYGNGNDVKVSFVGVERHVRNKGSMVSMPYEMDYNANSQRPSYDDNGILTLTDDAGSFYAYSGQDRSAWNYVFAETNSASWGSALGDDVLTEANKGVLMMPETEGLFRFTGKNNEMNDYLYTEVAANDYKTVILTQYDDRTSTSGGADFTSKEDMGWNCFGLPYLVSNYSTAKEVNIDGKNTYNLDIPHTLWLYYDGSTYSNATTPANGDGGFYSVSSWDTSDWNLPSGTEAVIWVGEGIFTQTAAVNSTEELRFYRPVYNTGSGAKPMMKAYNTRSYTGVEIKDEAIRSSFDVEVIGHNVRITNLEGNERIAIYDNAGRLIESAIADGYQYLTTLPHSGVYIVKVNTTTKKILIM